MKISPGDVEDLLVLVYTSNQQGLDKY